MPAIAKVLESVQCMFYLVFVIAIFTYSALLPAKEY